VKFTIRDLFLVTMIVAILVAWWLDHRRQGQTIENMQTQIDSMESTQSAYSGAWAIRFLSKPSAPAPNPPAK
jgi:hypothetical protein